MSFFVVVANNDSELRNNWRNAFRLSESGIYRINLVG